MKSFKRHGKKIVLMPRHGVEGFIVGKVDVTSDTVESVTVHKSEAEAAHDYRERVQALTAPNVTPLFS